MSTREAIQTQMSRSDMPGAPEDMWFRVANALAKRRGERWRLGKMEPVVGLEPTTVRLQIECSTN